MAQKPDDIKLHINKLIDEAMMHVQNGRYDQARFKFDELRKKTHHVVDMMHSYEQELQKFNNSTGIDDSTVKGLKNIKKIEESSIQKLKRQLAQKQIGKR